MKSGNLLFFAIADTSVHGFLLWTGIEIIILEIEYYKKDSLLSGKSVSFSVLKKQLEKTENIHDPETDNFIEMLCRNYGYIIIENYIMPDYIYDRDAGKLYKNRG